MIKAAAKKSDSRMPIAFVLQMATNGLGVARGLARNGIEVVGLDYHPNAPGLYSRYCRPVLCQDPQKHPDGVVEILLKEGKDLQEKGVLYPCSDPFLLLMSRYRKVLSEYFRFMIAPEEIVEGTVDKRQLHYWAEKTGTPYPRTLYPKDLSDLEEIKNQLTYPTFIKPCISHAFHRRFQVKGFVVNNYNELAEKCRLISPTGLEVMFQEVVRGPDTNHYGFATYIGREGRPIGPIAWHKIRQYPKDFGISSLSEIIHDKGIFSLALKFMEGIGYRGIGSIEIKKDQRDGKYRLLDMNARPWAMNIQATKAGINFPLIEYLDLTQESVPELADYKDGIRYHDSLDDIRTYITYRESGSLSFGDWVRSWLGAEVHARFAWDDLKPALVGSGYGVEYAKLFLTLLRSTRAAAG